jgi:NADH:ubiquinone oxidoreductase subunit H
VFFLNETLIGYCNYNFFLSSINWPSFIIQETTTYNSIFSYDFDYSSFTSDELHSFSQSFLEMIITLQFSLTNIILLPESLLRFQVDTNMKDAILIALKFLLCVSLLIFARGGIPRFRFDYLTKLG